MLQSAITTFLVIADWSILVSLFCNYLVVSEKVIYFCYGYDI